MTYPTADTINAFIEIVERDGIEPITEYLILKNKDTRIQPMLVFFKKIIINMMEDELFDEADGYSTGFISCLDLFRRQIQAEKVTLEELEIQIENMCGWSEYLESENLTLCNKNGELINKINELTRRNKELQEMYAVSSDGDDPNPT
jgi:hypothetical protein